MRQTLQCSRDVERTRVLMVATVLGVGGSHQVRVRDISINGAQLSTESVLPVDSDVIFKRADIFVAARVAWSNDKRAGLKFYRDLTPEEMSSTFHPVVEF